MSKQTWVLSWGLAIFLSGCGTELPDARHQNGNPIQGTEVGSGGQETAGAFVEVGYELVEMLRAQPVAQVSAEELLKAVQDTKVIAKPELFLDGAPVDALNFADASPPRIEVSHAGWQRLRRLRHEKVLLVFHEYLGILKKNDDHYQISRRIDRASICHRSPAIRLFFERKLRRSCYRIEIDDLRFFEELDFTGMGLTELKVGDLDHLTDVKYLTLTINRLTTLPRGLFRDMDSLTHLDLSKNKITALEPYVFEGATNLRSLRMAENSIQTIHRGAFSGLSIDLVGRVGEPVLPVIALEIGPRAQLKSGAFDGLVTTSISLSGSLASIEPKAFAATSPLKWLFFTVSDGEVSVSPETFVDAPAIDWVQIEVTGATPLPAGFFAPLTETKKLTLSLYRDADVTTEQLRELNSLPALQTLRFQSYREKEFSLPQLSQALTGLHCQHEHDTDGRGWGPVTCTRK